MIFICSDAFEALVRWLCKELKFFFLIRFHKLVDESFEAWIPKNPPKWKKKKNAVFIFSELSLFGFGYPGVMTLSSHDLSLFRLLIIGDAGKSWLLLSWRPRLPLLLSPTAFHSLWWEFQLMAPTKLFKNHCWKWASAAHPLWCNDTTCSFPRFRL